METSSPLAACVLHKKHSPANLTVELHHVIPVAWQLFWQPPVAPYPGKDQDGRGNLWDARTIACCPTGHRNVHVGIVKLMHLIAEGNDPAAFTGTQGAWAYQALERYRQVGGDLHALIAAGEWGMA